MKNQIDIYSKWEISVVYEKFYSRKGHKPYFQNKIYCSCKKKEFLKYAKVLEKEILIVKKFVLLVLYNLLCLSVRQSVRQWEKYDSCEDHYSNEHPVSYLLCYLWMCHPCLNDYGQSNIKHFV